MSGLSDIPVWRRMEPPPPPQGVDAAPVVIVGAGPVGLTAALDLGRRGHRVVVLNRLDFVAAGSKAICFSKRSLEVFDRLGVGDAMVEKGVVWNVGKVFWRDAPEPIYEFDLLPLKDQHRPAFINIQQYHVEDRLIDALQAWPNVQLRWGHEATAIDPGDAGARLQVAAREGGYALDAEHVLACDGARSSIRDMLGLEFEGRAFEDNFLIADIKMQGERPPERWFWFDPPFNGARSALLHRQPDDVWRLDFQLGPDIDRAASVRPQNVEPYVRAMLGPDVSFQEQWYSVYSFQCRRLARFVHDRVIFAGDSAHLVSPFGARGCNGGMADVDNLGWKLDLTLRGEAGPRLIQSYEHEAIVTADENILSSTRSTDFLSPRSAASRALRDAVLELASEHDFARPFVNSGRLSTPVSYPASPLNTPDADAWAGGVRPGSPAIDARLGDGWLLDQLGDRFVVLADGGVTGPMEGVVLLDLARMGWQLCSLRAIYDLSPGAAYLFRPDQYVAARWKSATPGDIAAALARARGKL